MSRAMSLGLHDAFDFRGLTPQNQKRAQSMFIGSGIGDGYIYALDTDGKVLFRRAWHHDAKLDRALGAIADRMVKP